MRLRGRLLVENAGATVIRDCGPRKAPGRGRSDEVPQTGVAPPRKGEPGKREVLLSKRTAGFTVFVVMCGSLRSRHKPIIGLAGGIGAGKSMVAGVLAELGAGLIDSDAIGRALLCESAVADTLRGWWGDSILDAEGRIDRRQVGDIVFNDPAQRARLEQLLHPRIERRREVLIEKFQADPGIRAIVLDSPLLFETGLHRCCDAVWFVEADREVRARRVAASRSWTSEESNRREKLHKPLDLKRAEADDTIVNNSGIDDLRPQVARLLSRVLERTPHARP